MKKPIIRIAETYMSKNINLEEYYKEWEFLIFIIYKIKELENINSTERFSYLVLEAVLRGKLAEWMRIIFLEWDDIIYFYEPNSYMISSNCEIFIATLSSLIPIKFCITSYF